MAQKVLLNVYDLSQGLARQLSTTFLGKAIEGIWHTGVVVFGYEYYFGGGIESCPQGRTPYGIPVNVVELGFTEVPKDVFDEYLQEISPRYTVQTYNLLQHNCNNFSEEVSQFLCGVGIPEFILKLPEEAINSPIGALILPMIQQFETTLRYGGVPQVPHASGIQGPSLSPTPQVLAIPVAPTKAFGAEKIADKSGKDAKGNFVPDKLGEARARVQEEITREFAALMAEGRLRASEAAAIATRRVMERHGKGAGLSSQS
ncbi:hypothetical protein GOP47_0012841 [Adiantum capillus-veneris]|uniref:PPPDE domain-containing protein n=1 Tax=Adiantum capillus-veneris TaxID=13818 RepID=A0A9D4URG1_ADICA|nr:hypothetical protein GOP47_0012841 [Adiantum capillus-veneris]